MIADEGRGERLFAARRITATDMGGDMVVIIEAQLAGFAARMHRELLVHMAALGVLCLGALAFAFLVGKRLVVDRVEHLARVSDSLAAGDLAARAFLPGHSGEFGRLALSINAMAEAISTRQRRLDRTLAELRRAEGKYRSIYENATEGIFRAPRPGASFRPIRPWPGCSASTPPRT